MGLGALLVRLHRLGELARVHRRLAPPPGSRGQARLGEKDYRKSGFECQQQTHCQIGDKN